MFTAGGVASGKTTAMLTIDSLKRASRAVQIIYDSTMSSFSSAKRRVSKALKAGKSVVILYVFTPIERSAKWLVLRAVETGRVVPTAAAARSHWQSQLTFLRLFGEYGPNAKTRFILIDNSGKRPKQIEPSRLHENLYAASGRFADRKAFTRYLGGLIRKALGRWRNSGKLIPETEAAFTLPN